MVGWQSNIPLNMMDFNHFKFLIQFAFTDYMHINGWFTLQKPLKVMGINLFDSVYLQTTMPISGWFTVQYTFKHDGFQPFDRVCVYKLRAHQWFVYSPINP